MKRGVNTKKEIFSQTAVWEGALNAIEKAHNEILNVFHKDFQQVIFTGCGSTYYLSLAAAALFQELTGIVSRAVPGSELLLNPKTILTKGRILLIAISRSGSTTETIEAVKQFKKNQKGQVISIAVKQFKKNQKGQVISITNYGDQPLVGLADLPIVIPEGQEVSVAQTGSFSSMFIASTALAVLADGRMDLFEKMHNLPEIGDSLIKKYEPIAKEYGENLDLDRFYFLGSGARYGLASEANLKMKEMSLTHSEPFYFLEFRHGPMSMVNENAAVIGLLSEKNRSYEEDVLIEMKTLGGHVLSLAENNADVSFNSGLEELIRNILYLPVLQIMAFYRSMSKGLDPDSPRNLSAVVHLEAGSQ
jgi:glucosamine--fructose-6-phosphate aminotransferase (isomerizing)